MERDGYRYGNYINAYTKGYEILGMVKGISEYGVNHILTISDIKTDKPTNDEMYYEPIPLTEEWLLKMGFNYVDAYECYAISYYNEVFESNSQFIIGKSFIVMDMDYDPNLKHVHQLQNLYHALTGEELTIKE